MNSVRLVPFLVGLGLMVGGSNMILSAQDATADTLKIIVLSGDDAADIAARKTAVPLTIEVRDRNDLPVPGASVVFLLPPNGAGGTFPGGSRSLTVTTDAMGRATTADVTLEGTGVFYIDVQASFRGREGRRRIRQTIYLTLAAAAAGGAGGSGSGAGWTPRETGVISTGAAAALGIGLAYGVGALGCISACK